MTYDLSSIEVWVIHNWSGTEIFGVEYRADSHSQYMFTQSLTVSCSASGNDKPKHITSMHHCTSLSVERGLGSPAWVMPRFAASCRTMDSATSLPAPGGNFSNTLWLSSEPCWIRVLNEAHSEYIPPWES